MAIPKFHELLTPILNILLDGKIRKKEEFSIPLAKHFSLSAHELAQKYDSGAKPSIFMNRIGWALSYLFNAGLISRPARGQYQINDLGREFLQKSEEEMISFVKNKVQHKNSSIIENNDQASKENKTPEEELYTSFEAIRQEIYDEILDTILKKDPYEFEKIVLQLMQKMGYGGSIEDSGKVTQKSNDGGIDVEIKEDILGLGRIHIQAKRYQKETTIGRQDIQNFAGALLGKQSNKGIFITTAKFSQNAKDYARTLSQARIILIDGLQLAEYIYQYDLGMQTEQTIQIKRLDSDYWDSFLDEKPSNEQ